MKNETIYMAYGSNLNLHQMTYRCPIAECYEDTGFDAHILTAAIGFLQEHHDMGFREAVATLLGSGPPQAISAAAGTMEKELERKPFTLPPKADNMHRLYAYLCKTRGIDHHVVTHFVRVGVLYEDVQHHNAVFLATGEKGKPLGGMKKSTLSSSGFRQTMAGSDTRYAFHHKGENRRLYVFEAAVDMLSFITLHPENWQQNSYLPLDGVSSKALHHFLSAHADVQDICLCLDNDDTDRMAAQRIRGELPERDYGYLYSCNILWIYNCLTASSGVSLISLSRLAHFM